MHSRVMVARSIVGIYGNKVPAGQFGGDAAKQQSQTMRKASVTGEEYEGTE